MQIGMVETNTYPETELNKLGIKYLKTLKLVILIKIKGERK